MAVLQVQGIHHITLNGADRQASVDFWQGILGMQLIFEQPNLDHQETNHLYFDCGDGRTLTVFTEEYRTAYKHEISQSVGHVHHIAFWVSQSSIRLAEKRLIKAGYPNDGIKDRGFMDSLYIRDPLGLLVELASYKFDPPQGSSYAQVLSEASKIRDKRNSKVIEEIDVLNAIISISKKHLSN